MDFLAFFEEIFSNMDDCQFALICSHNPPQIRAKGWKLGEIWPFLVNLRRNLEYVFYFLILHFTSLSTCGFLCAQWCRKSVVSICESKNKQWPLCQWGKKARSPWPSAEFYSLSSTFNIRSASASASDQHQHQHGHQQSSILLYRCGNIDVVRYYGPDRTRLNLKYRAPI